MAYAETFVVSRGKMVGKDAIEIRSKLKSLNFFAADFLFADLQRTVFASPADFSPMFSQTVDNSTGASRETNVNFAEKGTGIFDLSTIIFKIRNSGGSGTLQLYESGRDYGVTFQTIGTETVRSDAGDFPTIIIEVQSQFLADLGISNLKINITSDESAIPVLIRAKTGKGEFRALIASIQVAAVESSPLPTPVPVQTPKPTPKPSPTVEPYVDNQPLSGMPFELGEKLEYRITTGGRNVGVLSLTAKERKLVNGKDSLLLVASISGAEGTDVFRVGNGFRSNVDPISLAPYDGEIRFDGPLEAFSQSFRFDPTASKVHVAGANSVEVPVGTHNVLSLIYAMRQFNIAASNDASNPINDTRVAVYWQGAAQVFILRPSRSQGLKIDEREIMAQKISVSTGNQVLDALALGIWLSNDTRRIPVRFQIGSYQLDLILKDLTF